MQTAKKFIRKITEAPANNMRLLLFYRYISLLLTSIIFYILAPQSAFIFKVGVFLSLCIAAWIVTDLQKKYVANTQLLKAIVFAETIGLTLLLIPTGGINSPFIWYALNPVLIAASFVTPLFCFGVLIFYLSSATFIAQYMHNGEILTILQENSYFYLVCSLITLLVILFSGLTKALNVKAKALTETNQKYEDTLEHIMSLYHVIENLSANKSSERLAKEMTTALMNCTQSKEAFFWLSNLESNANHLEHTTKHTDLAFEIKRQWLNFMGYENSFIGKIHSDTYQMKVLRASNTIGMIGVLASSDQKNSLLQRTFEFLAELSEIMLERIHLDRMMNQMVVIEEQNRIANEIHDSVSQRLFGIVYALHSLQAKSDQITKEELHEEYQFLSQSANTTVKELRAAIYRLSSVKNEEELFSIRVKSYLDEYARLNDIEIQHKISGDETILSNTLKRELYRMICEACGNAVRHGECKSIVLECTILPEKVVLIIKDDGIGINPSEIKQKQGLGLHNMQEIVTTYAGTYSINGIAGVGTVLKIEIPNVLNQRKQEVSGL